MGDAAEPQRVALAVEALGRELVLDEPAVRAGEPALERARAEQLALAERLEHRRHLERTGPSLLGARAAQRLGAGELALARRIGRSERDLVEPAAGSPRRPVDQVEHLVDERRARGGRAVVVGRLPGEPEPLGRSRDAGVEQVALLVERLAAAQRRRGRAGRGDRRRAAGRRASGAGTRPRAGRRRRRAAPCPPGSGTDRAPGRGRRPVRATAAPRRSRSPRPPRRGRVARSPAARRSRPARRAARRRRRRRAARPGRTERRRRRRGRRAARRRRAPPARRS